MKISQHHSQILNRIADGLLDEVKKVLWANPHLDKGAPSHQALIVQQLSAIHPILDKRLREAYGWGVSYQDAQPDEVPSVPSREGD